MMSPSKLLTIDSTKEDDMLQIYPRTALLSSSNLGWDGIHLGYYHLPPFSIPEKISPQHLILIHPQLPLKMNVNQRFDRQWEKIQIQDGGIIFIPANVPHQANWDREHSYIALSLAPERLAQATPLTDAVQLSPCFKKSDPLILGIGLSLKNEIESEGMGGHLYIESLTTTLSLHLLRYYSTKSLQYIETEGLSKSQLCRIIEYIEENIDRNLTLAQLAAIANMSSSYFSYSFKLSTGYAPHQYIIQRRIERAKQLLIQKKLTIADIANSLGFSHQSHFNRHFKRLVGVTPKKFQQQK